MKTVESGVRPPVLLRVLVADQGSSTNDGLTALLSEFEGLSVYGCVQKPAKMLALINTLNPDVVILDLPVENSSGLQTLRQIKSLPEAPMVIVLGHYDLPVLREATLAIGADHYFNKATECDDLVDLLRKISSMNRGMVA